MGIFGVIGYIFRKVDLDPGPLILAFVLGRILEPALRQALLMSAGSPLIFFQRPISGTLMGFLLPFHSDPDCCDAEKKVEKIKRDILDSRGLESKNNERKGGKL